MFADLPPLDPLDLKKDEVAVNLAALMSFANVTRSALAEKLHCKKSRVTQVLSGRANPTLATLYEFSSCLGYDFDIVFRSFEEKRYFQPWQKVVQKTIPIPIVVSQNKMTTTELVIEIKTAEEIARDFVAGNHRPRYLSLYKCTEDLGARLTTIEVPSLRDVPKPSLSVFQITTEECEYAY
jgi:transcriptional regulator with XRE-family HTH domain